MNEVVIFSGFLSAQCAFSRLDTYLKAHPLSFAGKWKRCSWLVWLVHPHVLAGGHDMSIFLIGLFHAPLPLL